MKCLETRKRLGMKWRRYRTVDGRIVTTFELPSTVLFGAAPRPKLMERLEAFRRAEATHERRKRIEVLLAEGWKPIAIGVEVGITTRTVERIKASL